MLVKKQFDWHYINLVIEIILFIIMVVGLWTDDIYSLLYGGFSLVYMAIKTKGW